MCLVWVEVTARPAWRGGRPRVSAWWRLASTLKTGLKTEENLLTGGVALMQLASAFRKVKKKASAAALACEESLRSI